MTTTEVFPREDDHTKALRHDAAVEYLKNPRYDSVLGYTVALQDLWRILNPLEAARSAA